MGVSAAILKKEIEAKLASRIPAALSPTAPSLPRLHPSGNSALDKLLDGGFPLGSLCEVTGPECSGRSAIGLALLASASREGVCAYVDASDTCSPSSAAAAGVVLQNLLWVRFSSSLETLAPAPDKAVSLQVSEERKHPQLGQQHRGASNPRGETKGLTPALERILFDKEERRRRKTEGTPGHPNQPIGLFEASADQIQWEQFNSRKVDDRDPLRQLDRAAAEAARQRTAVTTAMLSRHELEKKPWNVLDRSLRATDQILQAGGFRVVVLDIASISPFQTQRIQCATWWRFQKTAKLSDTVFLVLSQAPCARSSAACVLECSAGELPRMDGVLYSAQHIAQVSRQRTGPELGKKAPGRVTSWRTAPAWMRVVGS